MFLRQFVALYFVNPFYNDDVFPMLQSFYNMSSVLSESLSTFCTGMRNNPIPYDLIFLHTGYVN